MWSKKRMMLKENDITFRITYFFHTAQEEAINYLNGEIKGAKYIFDKQLNAK